MQSSDEIFVFAVYTNSFLMCASYIIEIHGVTKVNICNYCLNREEFRWLLLHVQMITGVGLFNSKTSWLLIVLCTC